MFLDSVKRVVHNVLFLYDMVFSHETCKKSVSYNILCSVLKITLSLHSHSPHSHSTLTLYNCWQLLATPGMAPLKHTWLFLLFACQVSGWLLLINDPSACVRHQTRLPFLVAASLWYWSSNVEVRGETFGLGFQCHCPPDDGLIYMRMLNVCFNIEVSILVLFLYWNLCMNTGEKGTLLTWFKEIKKLYWGL